MDLVSPPVKNFQTILPARAEMFLVDRQKETGRTDGGKTWRS